MKHFRLLILIVSTIFIHSCFGWNSEECFPSFQEETDLVIPAEGGIYSFKVVAVATKTSWACFIGAFEMKVSIDGTIIKQKIVQLEKIEEDIHDGDTWDVKFYIPSNETTTHRNVIVETLKAKDLRYYRYEDHVDPGENTWQIVWQATQLGM
jgi:hypothetical protein